jgi:tetratricopeptide (TPR) repeat protein
MTRLRSRRQRPAEVTETRSGARWQRAYPFAVAGLLALAALLRAIAFLQIRALPNVTSDGLFYQETAQRIVDGSYLREATAFNFSPLYVFFLAAVFKTFGHGINAVRVVQMIVGIGSCGLIFLIGRRLFDRTVALIALSLAVLYVPSIHFEVQLLSISLAVFLMLASLQLLLLADARSTPALLLPAGLCLGLAALGSPTLLILTLPAGLWLGFPGWKARFNRAGVARAALFAGAVLLGILPATLWNYRATGQFVLVSSQGGINFYIGNNPEAPGFFVVPPGMEDSLSGINVTGAKHVAEAEAHRSLTAGEVSSHWFGKGLRFIVAEPLAAVRLFFRKCFLFANHYEVPLDLDQEAFKDYFPLLRWSLVSFGFVSLLGWTGAVICVRQFRKHGLPLLMLAVYALGVVVFFVSDRYRLPAVPLLILFSAFTVEWAWQKQRQRQAVPLLVAGVAVALAAFAIVYAPTGLQGARASLSFNVAIGYLKQNDFARARGQLEKCVQQDPDWLEARYKLALADHQLGDDAHALGEVDAVIARAPGNADAHALRGGILLARGLAVTARDELARSLSLVPGDQATAAKLKEADVAVQEANSGRPEERMAGLDGAGWRFLDGKEYPVAAATFAELLAANPRDPSVREKTLAGLGFSYASLGRLELAIHAFDDALAINPKNPVLHKNLALIHLKQGHPDKARPHVESYAALNPGDPILAQFNAALERQNSGPSKRPDRSFRKAGQ